MYEYNIDDVKLKNQIERDLRLRLPPEITWQLKVIVEPWLDSNITLNFRGGVYICTFCMFIGLLKDQYEPTIDYTVRTILDHNNNLPAKDRSSFAPLVGEQKFVILFVPDCVADANDDFVRKICPNILPNTPIQNVTWAIRIQQGSNEMKRVDCASVIKRWVAAQHDSSKVKFDQKILNVGSTDVQCTCIIGYLSNAPQ